MSGEAGDVEGAWDSCSGTGGYSDITAGASATIRDGEGNIVGSLMVTNFDDKSLRTYIDADAKYGLGGWGGDFNTAKDLISQVADIGATCLLYVHGHVDDADFYTYTFADRGDLTFSRDDLASDGWWVSSTLGQ